MSFGIARQSGLPQSPGRPGEPKEVGGRPVATEKRHTVAICAGGVGLLRQHICRGARGTDPPTGDGRIGAVGY